MRLTCNKKAYIQFREECNECPMKTECIDKDKSVFVGLLEPSPVNITIKVDADEHAGVDLLEPTINFDNIDKIDAESISKKIFEKFKNQISHSTGR